MYQQKQNDKKKYDNVNFIQKKNNDNSIHHYYKENCFFGHILIPLYNKFGTTILGGRQYHSKQLEQ